MRKRAILTIPFLLVFLLPLIIPAAAPAGPIVVGNALWYAFQFGGAGSFATNGSSVVASPSGNSTPADNPPWTFTSPQTVKFTVTDVSLYGDSFTLFDQGNPIGATPAVADGGGGGSTDPALALLDPLFSHGAFNLAPGSHSITIRADASPFGAGGAFFRTDAIPEPAALTLIGAAVTCVFARRKRRRSAAPTEAL